MHSELQGLINWRVASTAAGADLGFRKGGFQNVRVEARGKFFECHTHY